MPGPKSGWEAEDIDKRRLRVVLLNHNLNTAVAMREKALTREIARHRQQLNYWVFMQAPADGKLRADAIAQPWPMEALAWEQKTRIPAIPVAELLRATTAVAQGHLRCADKTDEASSASYRRIQEESKRDTLPAQHPRQVQMNRAIAARHQTYQEPGLLCVRHQSSRVDPSGIHYLGSRCVDSDPRSSHRGREYRLVVYPGGLRDQDRTRDRLHRGSGKWDF